ncbi:MAG: YqaJ viral recombinase family protein [Phycisphaeraceae bacterium]|nr:YqaJ viral recombinase family protein [Phycisphaeraceae bacterium]
MLTEQEIQARHSRIGASDVATILGMPTFKGRNAYTTYLEKCDMLEPEKRTTASINAGNRLEPTVLDYAEEQLGELKRNVVVWDPQGGPIASTLDGQVIADSVPVEAKTSGIEGPIHGNWGDEGTDEVPDAYLIQCQVQLLCTGADICHLVALLGGRGFKDFQIEPVPQLHKLIRDVSIDFFERYVTARKDPREDWADRLANKHGVTLDGDPCEPQLEIVKRFRKVPGSVTTFEDPTLIITWQRLRQERLDVEKEEQASLAKVLAGLCEAEAADLPGGGMLTYFEQNGAPLINREQMKTDGVWDKYTTPNRFRVPRLKTPKKGRG